MKITRVRITVVEVPQVAPVAPYRSHIRTSSTTRSAIIQIDTDEGVSGLFGAIWWREWRALARLTWTLRSLVAALVAYVAMLICDFAEGGKVIEDSLKIAGGALILIAFTAAYQEGPGGDASRAFDLDGEAD